MKTKQLKILKLVTPLALAALLIPAISSGFPTDTDTYQVNSVRVGSFTFADPSGPANNASHHRTFANGSSSRKCDLFSSS